MNRMKIVDLGMVLMIMANGILHGQAQDSADTISIEPTASWDSLANENYSISYPSEWGLDESGTMGTKFMLFSPLASETDRFRENVNLIIQNLAGYDIDLPKFVELSIAQVKTMISDGMVLESETISESEFPYHRIVYIGKQGLFNLQFEQYYWIVGDQAYVLTFTCEEAALSYYQSIGQEVLNSFTHKKGD